MKVLCIGNQTADTDIRTSHVAETNNSVNHGLVTDAQFQPNYPGYWHTSLADHDYNTILQLAQRFDSVYFLDQDYAALNYNLYRELKKSMTVQCENADMFDKQLYWQDQFKNNLSLCVFPFIMQSNRLCHISSSFISDDELDVVKQNMIAGVKNSQCEHCYAIEGRPTGFQPRAPKWGESNSPRESGSANWIANLDLQSVDDLLALNKSYYYIVEHGDFNGISDDALLNSNTWIRIVDTKTVEMPEFQDFLNKCIFNKSTAFTLLFSVNNAADVDDSLLSMLDYFDNVTVTVQLDNVVDSTCMHKIKNKNHTINFVCLVSINNIHLLDKIFKFIDTEFLGSFIQLECDSSVYNFPDKQQIIDVLDKCKQTTTYNYFRSLKSIVDSLHKKYYVNYYQNY